MPADFSASTVVSRQTAVHPRETVDYTIVVRNTGNEAPSYVEVAQPMPTAALFVSSSKEWTFDPALRQVRGHGPLQPGQSQALGLTLIAKPGTEGSMIANRTEVRYGANSYNLFHELEVSSAPKVRSGFGFDAGNVRVDGVSAVALLAIVAVIVFTFIGTRKSRALAMLVIGFGFLAIFASLAWKDYRMLTRYVESRCTVIDTLPPYAAVRYNDMVSVARADEASHAEELPCWYDPGDAKTVVLSRNISFAYVFSLPALLAIGIGGSMLRWKPQRR
ncbi:MAG TPA: hypothetical protein VF618_16385 [Thermoanaerobaculia bacterium]